MPPPRFNVLGLDYEALDAANRRFDPSQNPHLRYHQSSTGLKEKLDVLIAEFGRVWREHVAARGNSH
jgi:hypothetical protein